MFSQYIPVPKLYIYWKFLTWKVDISDYFFTRCRYSRQNISVENTLLFYQIQNFSAALIIIAFRNIKICFYSAGRYYSLYRPIYSLEFYITCHVISNCMSEWCNTAAKSFCIIYIFPFLYSCTNYYIFHLSMDVLKKIMLA